MENEEKTLEGNSSVCPSRFLQYYYYCPHYVLSAHANSKCLAAKDKPLHTLSMYK